MSEQKAGYCGAPGIPAMKNRPCPKPANILPDTVPDKWGGRRTPTLSPPAQASADGCRSYARGGGTARRPAQDGPQRACPERFAGGPVRAAYDSRRKKAGGCIHRDGRSSPRRREGSCGSIPDGVSAGTNRDRAQIGNSMRRRKNMARFDVSLDTLRFTRPLGSRLPSFGAIPQDLESAPVLTLIVPEARQEPGVPHGPAAARPFKTAN